MSPGRLSRECRTAPIFLDRTSLSPELAEARGGLSESAARFLISGPPSEKFAIEPVSEVVPNALTSLVQNDIPGQQRLW